MTVFYDAVESEYYAACVDQLLLARDGAASRGADIMELGVGTGEALARVLRRARFGGTVHGFERDPESYAYARKAIASEGVSERYLVHPGDFFDAVDGRPLDCAVSNPPYLPGPAARRLFPSLWGGDCGNDVSKRVLSCGFRLVVLMVSSFSDPIDTLAHASRCGYRLREWVVRPIELGRYSREPAVHRHVERLAGEGRAFLSGTSYLLAGVSWTKDGDAEDHWRSLADVLSAFGVSR